MDETANIIMFERGEYISYANCGLPYHVGGVSNPETRCSFRRPRP
jgi:NADPH-dependent 2,4-dienoyl-CoA reductase/sulfur reductase-like enzyme